MRASDLQIMKNTSTLSTLWSPAELARSLKRRYVRLELAFWEIAIPLLRRSPFLRFALARAYPLLKYTDLIVRLPKPLRWTCSGLCLGILIGFLGSYLFF